METAKTLLEPEYVFSACFEEITAYTSCLSE